MLSVQPRGPCPLARSHMPTAVIKSGLGDTFFIDKAKGIIFLVLIDELSNV